MSVLPHNVARSAFRRGEYVAWDCDGLRYRVRRDGPRRERGSWWVYPDQEGCVPCFYARTLALVGRRLAARDATCSGVGR